MDKKEKAIRAVLGIRQGLNPGDVEMDDETIRHIEQMSAFTMLAHCAGLTYVEPNIYKNDYGTHFVQTKYGFQPKDSLNKSQLIRELHKQLEAHEFTIKSQNSLIEKQTDKLNNHDRQMLQLEEKIKKTEKQLKEKDGYINELLTDIKFYRKDMDALKEELSNSQAVYQRALNIVEKKIRKEMRGLNPLNTKSKYENMLAIIMGMRIVIQSRYLNNNEKLIRMDKFVESLHTEINKPEKEEREEPPAGRWR